MADPAIPISSYLETIVNPEEGPEFQPVFVASTSISSPSNVIPPAT